MFNSFDVFLFDGIQSRDVARESSKNRKKKRAKKKTGACSVFPQLLFRWRNTWRENNKQLFRDTLLPTPP